MPPFDAPANAMAGIYCATIAKGQLFQRVHDQFKKYELAASPDVPGRATFKRFNSSLWTDGATRPYLLEVGQPFPALAWQRQVRVAENA